MGAALANNESNVPFLQYKSINENNIIYRKKDTVERIKLKCVGSNELGGDAAPIATTDDGDLGLERWHWSVYSGGGVIVDGGTVTEGRSHEEREK